MASKKKGQTKTEGGLMEAKDGFPKGDDFEIFLTKQMKHSNT